MAAVKPWGKFREGIKGALDGVDSGEIPTPLFTLAAARVKLGFNTLYQAANQTLEDVSKNGPLTLIFPTGFASGDVRALHGQAVPVKIYLQRPTTDPWEAVEVDDLAFNVVRALKDGEAAFTTAGTTPPTTVTLEAVEFDVNTQGLIVIRLQVEGQTR